MTVMSSPDWPDEPSLYPYNAVQMLSAKRLLVLAPHPDDEVLGCGGLIAATLAGGAEVQVLVASDGGQGGDPVLREQESIAAAEVLSVGDNRLRPQFWRLPDRGLREVSGLVSRLKDLITASLADCVLLPSPFEIHPDHRALCIAGLQAICASESKAELLFYEVGQPLMPNLLVDITTQLDRKRAALQCFASQLAVQDYDEQLLGLNRFRAYTLGPAVTHAEAFWRVAPDALAGGLDALLRDLDARMRSRFGGLLKSAR